jgi:hypothetical protein
VLGGLRDAIRAGVGDVGEEVIKIASGRLRGHIQFRGVKEIHVGVAEGGLHLVVHDDGVQGREGGRGGILCRSHASSFLVSLVLEGRRPAAFAVFWMLMDDRVRVVGEVGRGSVDRRTNTCTVEELSHAV